MTLTVAFLILCLAAPAFMPNDPHYVDLKNAKLPPNDQYPWGTDGMGRCVFSRVLAGASTTVFSALAIVGLTLAIGSLIGIIGGYAGGMVDSMLMRIVDVFLAFPGMVLALAVAGMLGKGLDNAIIALAAVGWPQYARLSRSYVLSLRQENFILAAKLNGQTSLSILFRHILPNTMRPVVVTASLSISGTILSLASLSFLGLGAQPPAAEWGSMIADGRGLMQRFPWMVFYPGMAIFITSILFNLLGDSVRDVLDPLDSKHMFANLKKKGRKPA
ncbi:MAG: nickel transporter permease [Limnochordia bacterium]